MIVSLFFFFKQKTAYEMRISDWSSDVCSSDLPGLRRRAIASRSLLVMLKFDGKAVAAALCAASAAFLPLGVQAQAAVGPHADLCKNNASAVLVEVVGLKSRTGNVRIQL